MQRTTLSPRNVMDSVPAEYTVEDSFRGTCLYWEAHRGQGKICYNDPKTGEQQHPIHVHFKGLCQPLHYLEPTQEYVFWLVPGHNNSWWPQAWNVKPYVKHVPDFETLKLDELTSNFPPINKMSTSFSKSRRTNVEEEKAMKDEEDQRVRMDGEITGEGVACSIDEKIKTDATPAASAPMQPTLTPEQCAVGVAFDGIKDEMIKLMSTTNAGRTSIIDQQQEEIDALKGDVAQLRMSMAVLIEAVRENTDKIGKLEANKLHMLAQSLQ